MPRAAYTAGITVTRDGDSILLEADTEPPRALLVAIARNKLAILDLLKPGRDECCACGWPRLEMDGRVHKRRR